MRTTRLIGSGLVMGAALLGWPVLSHAQEAAASTITPTAASTSATSPAPMALPYGAAEVVKMHQGGIGKDIIMGYVESGVGPFRLTADQIIYLQSIGLPQDVVKAMIHRDGELQRSSMAWQPQPSSAAYSQAQSGQSTLPPGGQAPIAMPSSPGPDVAYTTPPAVYPDYSGDYGYAYPYYDGGVVYAGPGYWGWPYGGWGWGSGFHGGFRGGFGPGFHGGFPGGFHGGAGFHGGGGSHGGGGFHGGGGGSFHGGAGGGSHGGGGGGGRR